MTHVTEQDLVLHYYGELQGADERSVASHLSGCAACRHDFTRLQRVLGTIDESALALELPDGFERTVWARLEPDLRSPRRAWFSWMVLNPMPLALTAAVVVLVGAAFFAGRLSSPKAPATTTAANPSEQVRERILLVDLGEHLDRSQMMLIELVSADPQATLDVTGERAHAEQLIAANRLYRQTAVSTGDTAMGNLLDELERVLVEVAAGPGELSPEQLDSVQKQIEGKGLLFRVRIISSEVRERQKQAIQRRASQRS
jgi:hypothetical protein